MRAGDSVVLFIRQRINRDPVMAKATSIMLVPFAGKGQEVTCLKLNRVNFWLATIDSNRIKDESVREKVRLYQEECADVLYEHFSGKRKGIPEVDSDPDDLPTTAERLRLVTEARQTFSQVAAREMWFRQGLPIVPSMMSPPPNDLFNYSQINHGEAAA